MEKPVLRQVGGDWYNARPGVTQHKDYCAAVRAPYFEGSSSKYVMRWQRKGGVQDLEKAIHFIEFRMAAYSQGFYPWNGCSKQSKLFDKFLKDNNVPDDEASIIDLILHWQDMKDLEKAIKWIHDLMTSEPDGSYVNQD